MNRNTNKLKEVDQTGVKEADMKEVDVKETDVAEVTEVKEYGARTTRKRQHTTQQSPWSASILTLATSCAAIVLLGTILHSFFNLQQEPKGCQMSYMMPMFAHFSDFDTEHTRFASKYSLYLYREGGIDEDTKVKGIPVVFIPGNAGSYKQVRPIAAEAATYFQNVLREHPAAIAAGKRPFDFFSVDFNEDITAFHGQTLLDQAEYLNEAIAFILALYNTPGRFERDSDLPDPKSVIIIGHSMGGMVARTMLTISNYQEDTINTIITLSAPHARAPVSFDAEMVSTYQNVNNYWRRSFLLDSPNPLEQVSLISVAGGGLDTMIPSEYTSVTSLVPDTHGFTVFTSSIPGVWTSMDHLAIMWCDQFRKALIRSMFDIVDARRRTQTIPRSDRVRSFQRNLLTGMEPVIRKDTTPEPLDTLLIVQESLLNSADSASAINTNKASALKTATDNNTQRIAIHSHGHTKANVFAAPAGSRFTLLADMQDFDVFICKRASGHSYTNTIEISGAARLACKHAGDAIQIPASTNTSQNAFEDARPFSYLQLDLHSDKYIAVITRPTDDTNEWAIAEVTKSSTILINKGHHELILSGLQTHLPADRSLMTEVKIPQIHSTLFAYTLKVDRQPCHELFAPLLRQYIAEPYESKYFVNTRGGNINVHGLSPYIPPRLSGGELTEGLSLQIWADPFCNTTIDISLEVDKLGSAGKIVMRYRTMVAVLPLLVIFIVIRKQFKVYDATGFFISFSESMDHCIRTSIPFVFLALTLLAVSLAKAAQGSWTYEWISTLMGTSNTLPVDFTTNDFMLGTQDPFLWFLVPLFGIISVGICITANYLVIILMSIIAATYTWIKSLVSSTSQSTMLSNPPHQRIITTAILLLLVTTLIPYQFAYLVLTIVQFATCIRGMSVANATKTAAAYNFYNCAHSFLLLMLWVLPINIPVLIVWIHNLAVHWMTPFSTHHNLLAILPLVLCVETMSTGIMVPRITGRARHLTNTLTFFFALYAAVYGNTYAYRLHHLLNALAAWFLIIYMASASSGTLGVFAKPLRSVLGMTTGAEDISRHLTREDMKKTP